MKELTLVQQVKYRWFVSDSWELSANKPPKQVKGFVVHECLISYKGSHVRGYGRSFAEAELNAVAAAIGYRRIGLLSNAERPL